MTAVNRKKNTIRILLYLALSLLWLAFDMSAAAASFPGAPQMISGTVTVAGNPSGAGATVVAKQSGVQLASATTDSQSKYGMAVSGDLGIQIDFYVNGVKANESASYIAGQITTLNLTTSSGGTATSALSISTSALPGGTVGTAYSTTLFASGGSGSYTFTVSSGSLPTGLSLSNAGVVYGTPTTAASTSFTVLVTDSASHTASATYSIAVGSAATTTTPTTAATPTTTATPTTPTYSNTSATNSSSGSSSSSSGTSTSTSTGSSSSQPSSTPASAALPAFAMSDMSATQSGNHVNISVRVANNGKAQGTKSLLLKINDNVEAQQDVVLDPGESQVVNFTVNKNTPGTYKASIDPLSADFTIASVATTQQSNNQGIPTLGILIAGGLLVGILILIVIVRKR